MNKILITGGAGFIGSNLIDHFLEKGHYVVCLDNLSTGFEKNIEHNYGNSNFKFIKGDIRNFDTCINAIDGCDFVLHQAALGSVPRSIIDPANTNSVNVDGFLNVLIAARDAKVKRFVYAASSSTYGDSKKLPKIEEEIGKPLSPYAITKYVNELYADVFAKNYGMQCIGLRYFNVFGKRQDPNGAYAAVIPLWVNKLIKHESPVINGDGSFSRDFTFVENVIEANEKSLLISTEKFILKLNEYYKQCKNKQIEQNKLSIHLENIRGNNDYFSEVFNIAFGSNTTLLKLFNELRKNLSFYDREIINIEPVHSSERIGDIPHSKASILKAKTIIDYDPKYDSTKGFELIAEWYMKEYKNIK